MKKHMIITLVVAAMLLLPMTSALATESFIQPTEMLQWDADRAYNGYTAYVGGGSNLLIDMEGQVVKEWPEFEDNSVSGYFYILENGNIRRMTSPAGAPGRTGYGGGPGQGIEEISWDGELLWRWNAFDGADGGTNTFRQHHDFQRIYNKTLGEYTYLALVWVKKGAADAVALGADPNMPTSLGNWSPCGIMEVRPDYNQVIQNGIGGDNGPELLWYWSFSDHFVTSDPDGTAVADDFTDVNGRTNAPAVVLGALEDVSDYPNKLDIHGVHYTVIDGPRADMQHCNSFDYDDTTGHIAINAKASSEFFVLDHDGTFVSATDFDANMAAARSEDGDFIYRFGNPSNYNQGEAPGYFDEGDQQMYGSHDIQYIRPYHWRPTRLDSDNWAEPTAAVALRGAGNFLIFDNGCYNPVNRVSKLLEMNPYVMDEDLNESTTGYVNPPDAGYDGQDSNQIVWSFNGREAEFYSLHISSTQRLPNGNTLADAGRKGHFFEVTEDGDVVWEYVVPFKRNVGPVTALNQGDDNTNSTFRAYRFGPNWPGLAGKDLTPGSTLTGRIPSGVGGGDVYPVAPPAPTGWGTSGMSTGEGGGGAAGGTGTGGGTGY